MKAVEDYGWRDAGASHAHGYIAPTLLRLLREEGARTVLDLGCGNGALTHAMRASGFEVVGCDSDEEGIELARKGGGRFERLGVYDDPRELGDNRFDAVVSVEVVEHLLMPAYLPRFAREVLRPGALLIITTPYHGYLKNLSISLLDGWDRHFHPLRDGGHVKFFSKATLRALLEREGFSVKEFLGVGRMPFLWKSLIAVAQNPSSTEERAL